MELTPGTVITHKWLGRELVIVDSELGEGGDVYYIANYLDVNGRLEAIYFSKSFIEKVYTIKLRGDAKV